MHDQHYQMNRDAWDRMASVHARSAMYAPMIEALRAGRSALLPIEQRELPPLRGLRLLHLQCHIGTDTLSMALQGADVTGIDFSEVAISQARRLAADLNLPARFTHSDVYRTRDAVEGHFDLVFTSYGTICWLHDLEAWARVIADCLKPGGAFYIIDGHPMALALDETSTAAGGFRLKHAILTRPDQPGIFASDRSYADPDLRFEPKPMAEWAHPISEVVNALLRAGLHLEFLNEHPECAWAMLECMQLGDDGLYRLPDDAGLRIPFLFSLMARKPA